MKCHKRLGIKAAQTLVNFQSMGYIQTYSVMSQSCWGGVGVLELCFVAWVSSASTIDLCKITPVTIDRFKVVHLLPDGLASSQPRHLQTHDDSTKGFSSSSESVFWSVGAVTPPAQTRPWANISWSSSPVHVSFNSITHSPFRRTHVYQRQTLSYDGMRIWSSRLWSYRCKQDAFKNKNDRFSKWRHYFKCGGKRCVF